VRGRIRHRVGPIRKMEWVARRRPDKNRAPADERRYEGINGSRAIVLAVKEYRYGIEGYAGF